MTLLKPTKAEIIDRATIVARKHVETELLDNRIPLPCMEELAQLCNAMNWTLNNGGEDDLTPLDWLEIFRLAAVNAALWQREDELRQGLDHETLKKVAIEIANLNDHRRKIMATLPGGSDVKVYR